ncbi:cysteine proteinase [Scleroderma citrinum]
MASPQPPYPHPSTSSYFPHQPPPSHAYGSRSPVPLPSHAPLQYQYPMPPMNGRGHHIHSPSSSRVHSQGRGYPPSRGGHNYQNYHPHPPHHHSPYTPYSPHYPPSHSHHATYPHIHTPPVPFSPNYAIHPSTPYSSQAQAQHPLSPLPKQLSMLSSLSPRHTPPSQPSEPEDSTPQSPNDDAPKVDTEQLVDNPPLSDAPENLDIRTDPTDLRPSPPQSPVTHHTATSTLLPIPNSPDATLTQSILIQSPEYVIWSRRPTNPSSAPGIIISPLARPPDDIRQKALDLAPPPTSPVSQHEEILQQESPPTSTDPVDVQSSSATETTTTSSAANTPVLTSPISTNTSLSVAVSSSVKVAQEDESTHAATPQVETATLPTEQPTVEDIPAIDASPSPPISSASSPSKPTVPRPSFASILRQTGPASSKPNALPKSSVVGFSIPAASSTSAAASIPITKKPELLSLLTSGPSSQPLMKIRPRGLVNTGNLCFANATLQVLVYCPPFWKLFCELGKFLDSPSDIDASTSKTPLVDATIRFLREFIPKQKTPPDGKGKAVDRAYNAYDEEEEDIMDSFIPSYVYDALKEKKRFDHMRGGHQEDAEEFLGFYLDTLEEELLSIASSLQSKTAEGQVHCESSQDSAREDGPWLEVGKRNRTAVTRTVKTAESPITRMFGGKFRSTLRVPHQKESVIFEDWRSLRLDIQRDQIHSIKDALSYISAPQSVQVTSVTRPGAILDATQTMHIDSLPPILVLHLKRFLYDANAGGAAKVGKQVSFGPELEIGNDVMAPGRKIPSTRYKLFGVLYHHGSSASGGHYTLDVLHPNINNDHSHSHSSVKPREGWIRIDDEFVSDVSSDIVFSPPERDDRCAYLLFYRRVGGTRT